MNRVQAEIVYEPEGDEPSFFTDQSVYQMYLWHSRTERVLRNLIGTELKGFKLSLMEWLLLGIVSEGPEGGMSLSEIAKRMDVSQPQVTALMSNITSQKLVRQKVQRQDRRSRHVMLSSRGQRLLGQAEEAVTEKMREALRGLSQKQFAAYIETIRKLCDEERGARIEGQTKDNKEKSS